MDPHRQRRDRTLAAVTGTPGSAANDLRKRVYDGDDPEPLAVLLDRVREHAPDVTDAMIAEAKAAGYDDDALFELILAAALGEADRRLDRALTELDLAFPEGP